MVLKGRLASKAGGFAETELLEGQLEEHLPFSPSRPSLGGGVIPGIYPACVQAHL